MNRRRLVLTLLLTLAIAWGSLAAVLSIGWEPKLGLDLQGGFEVVLVAPGEIDAQVLEKSKDIMRRRIENLGSVQEPEISILGERAILVQLPGVENRDRALQAVGTTGELSMRPVFGIFPSSPLLLDPEGEHPDGLDPVTGLTVVDDVTKEAYLLSQDGAVFYVGGAFLTGADMTGADPGFTGVHAGGGGWVVTPEFTAAGGELFRLATGELAAFPLNDPRRQLAIVVDGEVISAPQVSADVQPGVGLDPDAVVITVGTTEDPQAEAEDLAAFLRYGALPTTFDRERVESVSASLGSDSLRAGLIAGIGGLLLVGLYMVIYYRSLGFITVIGLSVFGSLLMVIIILLGRFLGTTLTLAAVTGIIVSIGITSDSYIVYYERIKEEHRRGRSLRPAADSAFSSAFRTILTGDFVTLLGAALLFVLAEGPVKAFALALLIAVVIDVFVAYLYTRPAVALMVRSRFGEGGWFSVRGAMGRSKQEAEDLSLAEVPT